MVTIKNSLWVDILQELKAEGYCYTIEEVGYLSPYLRSHLKRIGEFVLEPELELIHS